MSTYHHGDLRTALLQAAGDLLEEQGLGALSLREAARRAGVSHNAPYRHFPDRNALLAALASEGFSRLGDDLRGRAGRDMGDAYVRFALAHPNRFRLMFGGLIEMAAHPALREAANATYEALVSAFRAQRDVADPALAAAAAWSLVHGLAQLMLDGHFREAGKAPDFARQVIGAVRFAAAPRAV